MIRLRKILFIIFTLLYIIICPSLILYSLGIVVKPGKKKMVKTGVIYVATIPEGASITINGKPHKEETPTLADNLLPGTYQIRIKADHYQVWETTVEVSAEKATPLENILLLPDPIKPVDLTDIPADRLTAVDENPFVLVSTGDNAKDFLLHIWDESIRQNILPGRQNQSLLLRPLFPRNLSTQKNRVIKNYSVAASPYMIFEVDTENGKKYFWTDLIFGPSKTEEITNLFPVGPRSIQWTQNDPRHLLSLQDHAINRIDMATRAIYPGIIQNVENFTTFNQTIFYLTSDRSLLKASSNDIEDTTRLASNSPLFNDLIIRHFPFPSLTAVSDQIVFLIGQDGQLISNLKPYVIAEKNIKGFKWNKRSQKLAFWSEKQIGYIDLSKKDPDGKIVSQFVHFEFKNIIHAYWVNDGSHLLIADHDQVWIADIQCCDQNDIRKIIDIQPRSDIYFSQRTGKVFFLAKESGRLSSLDIIPQHALIAPATGEKRPTIEDEK